MIPLSWCIRTFRACFRPLAGFWLLNLMHSTSKHRRRPSIPSPCGVLVIKLEKAQQMQQAAQIFRPLAGFWLLNSETEKGETRAGKRFRPLAGFWLLNQTQKERRTHVHYFRPLAGFWFLNGSVRGLSRHRHFKFPSPCGVLVLKYRIMMYQAQRIKVSVPLRGSGS